MGQRLATAQEIGAQISQAEAFAEKMKKSIGIQVIGGPEGKTTMVRALDPRQYDDKDRTTPAWLDFITI